MIEQKDIDRLLAGRKIVDAYRAVAAEYREKASISIDSKLSADIATTKEAYQAREEATKKMNKELAKLGFDSVDAFSKFNDSLNMEAFKDCRPIKGTCDLCKGYDKEPPCKTFYKAAACINSFTPVLDDRIYKISLDIYSGRTSYQACPKGHGFQPDTDNYKELPFDVKWKI